MLCRIMSSNEISCNSAGTKDFLGLKAGGLFAILVASAIGVAVPSFTYNNQRLHPYYFVLRAFAAGVVLATG